MHGLNYKVKPSVTLHEVLVGFICSLMVIKTCMVPRRRPFSKKRLLQDAVQVLC